MKSKLSIFSSAVLFAVSLLYAANPTGRASAKQDVSDGACGNPVSQLKRIVSGMTPAEGEKAAFALANCYIAANDQGNLQILLDRYLTYYAGDPFRARMEVIAAERCLKKDSTLAKGVGMLLDAFTYSKSGALRDSIRPVLLQTISADPRLSVEMLADFLEQSSASQVITNAIWLRLGKESAAKKNAKAARYWYRRVVNAGIDSESVDLARRALDDLNGQATVPTVLVLSPLSGNFAEFGNAAVNGVKLAFEQANLKGKVDLRIADTRADAVEALRRTRQAVAQDSVIAIIGPVMSAPAATVASWLGATHPEIPMLTPTATDAGISRMGPNIFQVNVSMDNLATGIAEYAVNCLGIHEFAILSPIGDFGTAMAESFSRSVENAGGAVVAKQEFEEGRPDYTTEFRKLRAVYFKRWLNKRNIALGVNDLDAMGASARRGGLQDSVLTIPGIFIPSSSPADAGLIAGQVAFHKFKGTLLGTSGWYGNDLIEEGKSLVDGSYFSVSFAGADSSKTYRDFAASYKARWKEEPKADRVSGLSYSAAGIVFSLFASGESNFVKKIYSQKEFPGVYGDVRFEKGANANIQIIGIDTGKFVNKTSCPAPAQGK